MPTRSAAAGTWSNDNAWKYRDWIIRSLNADKPYDRFITEQIAGDLLPAKSKQAKSQQIIATGFLAVGRKELPEYDKEKQRMDVVDEQLDTLGKSLLGLSLGCARCHDHKFDPIPTRDYYALAGIFESIQTVDKPRGGPLSTWVTVKLPDGSGEALAVKERSKPVDSRICIRGDWGNRGAVVKRHFLTAWEQSSPPVSRKSSGRLQLARWITSPENPLTARVMANRIWHWLMGRGIVATPDNFGTRAAPPTHRRLLDWLAVKLIEDGWSIKRSVRRIVLSRTYRQSSRHDAAAGETDPRNLLRWRQQRRRMDAEILRDWMLSLAGNLDRKPFGRTLTFTGRLDESREKPTKLDPSHRRSVYLPRYREDKQFNMLVLFDAAHPAMVTGRRNRTTLPTQALFLLNSRFVARQAAAVTDRLPWGEDATDAQRLGDMYRLLLGRAPTQEETADDLAFIGELRPSDGAAEDAHRIAWRTLCHTVLASNEFLFVE